MVIKETFIEKFFPAWALKRHQNKVNLQSLKRAYEAGKPSEQFKPVPVSQGPNTNTQQAAEKMRDQARDLDENHDLAISVLDELVNKIVGSNFNIAPIVLLKNGQPDIKTNDQLTRLWKEFSKRPDVTRSMSIGQFFRLTCRTWLRDGDVAVRKIRGSAIKHPTPIPLSLELIEPDYLPFQKNELGPGNTIIQGIEVDKWGAPVNYHFLTESPYQIYPGAPSHMVLNTRPVPADQVLFLKFSRRISQVRGVTIFHGVIRRFQDVKDYEESERIAARVAAAMTGYIKKDLDSAGLDDLAKQDRGFEMSPGMIFDNLLPGEEVGTISSNRPNPELMPFRNAMLRAIAGGTGTSFSGIANTYDGTYSSQRQELVEAKIAYDVPREYFINECVLPIWNEFVLMALVFGGLTISPATDKDTLFDSDIHGVAMPWIDPLKEVKADETAVLNKFKSRSQVIRERGGDPEAVKAEIAMEEPLILEPETEPAEPEETDETDDDENDEGAENGEQEET